MRPTTPLLLAALALLVGAPAPAAAQRAAGLADAALIVNPFWEVRSLPANDADLGTFAETEPVPTDGRLGWFLQQFRLSDLEDTGANAAPELWLGEDLVPGTTAEETVGTGVWVWFTPDAPLEPESAYVWEFGDEQDMITEFVTATTDVASLDVADEHAATVRSTWYAGTPNQGPWLNVEATTSANRESVGSSRLSVMRIVSTDADGVELVRDIVPVGMDRASYVSWQDYPGRGARPDEVCVTVTHENGLGEASDPLELCGETVTASGCSVASTSPGAAGALVGLLLPLLSTIRRRR